MHFRRILCSLLAAVYLATAAAVPVYTTTSFVAPVTAEAGLGKWALRGIVAVAIKNAGKRAGKAALAKVRTMALEKARKAALDPRKARAASGMVDKAITHARKFVRRNPFYEQQGKRVISELRRYRDEVTALARKGTGRNKKKVEKLPGDWKYHPTPTTSSLKEFGKLKRTTDKTPVQGGGGTRPRWRDDKGNIYEFDRQHGTMEKYNSRGKHLGEYDRTTARQTKPADPTRRVEP